MVLHFERHVLSFVLPSAGFRIRVRKIGSNETSAQSFERRVINLAASVISFAFGSAKESIEAAWNEAFEAMCTGFVTSNV